MGRIVFIIRSKVFVCGIAGFLLLLGLPSLAYSQVVDYHRGPERFTFQDGWESNTFDYEMQVKRDKYLTLSGTFMTLSLVGFMSGMMIYDFIAIKDINKPKFHEILLSVVPGAAIAAPFLACGIYFGRKAQKITLQTAFDRIPRHPSQTSSFGISMLMLYNF